MGVPGLFSWVRRQFPEAIIPEEVWSKSSPAPVSSLFVDLNHILHACTHPEYPYEEPSSRDAMLEAILLYIEALLALVQPTDLLFISSAFLFVSKIRLGPRRDHLGLHRLKTGEDSRSTQRGQRISTSRTSRT